MYAISANRPGYSDYFVMSPPSSYRSPSWMSYPPEPEDLPRQWNDTPVRHVKLPGHIETWDSKSCKPFLEQYFQCVKQSFSSPCRTHVILKPSAEVVCRWHWVETASNLVGQIRSALLCYVVKFGKQGIRFFLESVLLWVRCNRLCWFFTFI